MQTSILSPGAQAAASGPTGLTTADGGLALVMDRVVFLKQMQQVANRIHATDNLQTWQLDLAQDICDLLQADRMTLYEADANGQEIVSRVKTGLNKLKDIRLPVDERSIAGYVAATRQMLNIANVYDAQELQRLSATLNFHKGVDNFTGYRSRQMLVLPLTVEHQMLGVLQLINFKGSTGPFPALLVDGARELAQTLAVAMLRRRQGHGVAGGVRAAGTAGTTGAPTSAGTTGTPTSASVESGHASGVVAASAPAPADVPSGERLAARFGVPFEPFKPNRVKPTELLRNLRREFAESSGWVPLEEGLSGIVVVCTDPDRTRASKVVVNVYNKRKIDYRVTTEEEFERFLHDYFGDSNKAADSVSDLLSDLSDTEDASDGGADEVSAASDNELVRLVNRVVVEAYQQGASDIHVEPRPGKGKTIIRLRRDGVLVNYIEVPAAFRNALVTRIKIMCDLDIAEKRRPQDGKIKFRKFGPLDIELRVATIPTAGGTEDVVMRILAAGKPLPLDDIGLSARNLQQLRGCVEKPYGLFLVCGPTGSGKTTTLHSVLAHLNKPDTKIWTAEDPVEITQDGLRQVQVNRKAGLDFVAVMRAFLRADPDIIMVGEMRDAETAGTGIEASLTGHLVMSTLHTNSAVESVIRLLDMGMDPFNFADALLGILAQRLARRLCKDCKEPYEPGAAELAQLRDEFCTELAHTPAWKADPAQARAAVEDSWREQFSQDGRYQLYRAKGCPACQDTGYRGRIALHELLVATDGVKLLIQERAKVPEILATALGEGMRTLKMDGIEKVLQGATDIHRVREVCIK